MRLIIVIDYDIGQTPIYLYSGISGLDYGMFCKQHFHLHKHWSDQEKFLTLVNRLVRAVLWNEALNCLSIAQHELYFNTQTSPL